MKKTLYNLQLFAEGDPVNNTEPGADPNTDPTGEPQGEPQGEPGTDPKPGSTKKYDDDDVNRIVKQKKAEWQKQQDKAVEEAKKLAGMNAAQKAEYERDAALKELDEYKRKEALNEMSKTARKMLADEGINISDDLLSTLVTPEAEATQTNINNFVKLFKAEVEKGIKAQATGVTPKIIQNNSEGLSEIEKRIAKYN